MTKLFLLCLSSGWESGEENVLLNHCWNYSRDGTVSTESQKRVKMNAVGQTSNEYEERDSTAP